MASSSAIQGGAMAKNSSRRPKERVKPPAASTAAAALVERGIPLDVKGTVLIAQANARIALHDRTADAMTKELKAIPDEATDNLSTEMNRRQRRTELTRSVAAHQDHARFLRFVRDHIVRDRLYRVTLADMSILEITPKGSLL
jgi:hypothetical protein